MLFLSAVVSGRRQNSLPVAKCISAGAVDRATGGSGQAPSRGQPWQGPADSAVGPSGMAGYLLFVHPHSKAGSRFYFCFLCNVSKVWPLLPGRAARPSSRDASCPASLFLLKASVCLQGGAGDGLSWARGSDRPGPHFWVISLSARKEGEALASPPSPGHADILTSPFNFTSPLYFQFSPSGSSQL